MIPTTDFALVCENPIHPVPMSGSPINTLTFEYLDGVIAHISFVGNGRAGPSAHMFASIDDGLKVEIDSNELIAASTNGRLHRLSFDAGRGLLRIKWSADDAEFGGRCRILLPPYYAFRMPNRDR